MRTEAEQAALKAEIAAIPSWYHAIDLGDGVETPGAFRMADYLDPYHFPSLEGKRVLDVGASNGFFAVEFARRGAAEVVAIDLPDWASHDWTPRYMAEFEAKPAADREAIDKAVLLKGFELVTRELGRGRVRKVESRIYDLTPEALGGPFDVVFCGSMLMHVRDPILGMQRMRACCKDEGRLILSVSTFAEDDPRPIARFCGEWDQCNWWQMNPAAVKQALTCSDFGSFEFEDHFVLEDTSGRFKDPTFVCHGLPRQGA